MCNDEVTVIDKEGNEIARVDQLVPYAAPMPTWAYLPALIPLPLVIVGVSIKDMFTGTREVSVFERRVVMINGLMSLVFWLTLGGGTVALFGLAAVSILYALFMPGRKGS